MREYVWLGTTPVAVIQANTPYFIHPDHLDTPRVVTNQANTIVWRWDSDPFGTTPPNEDPDSDGQSFVFNLRFPGQYFDKETGLHYNYYRNDSPQIGRYLESDPIGLEGGINTYAYVRSAPLQLTDPDGLQVAITPATALPIPGVTNAASQANASIARGLTKILSRNADDSSAESIVYDSAGQKVSPRAQCMEPPGDCTSGQHRSQQDEVDRACQGPRACRPGMNQIEIIINREKNRECAMARDRINKRSLRRG